MSYRDETKPIHYPHLHRMWMGDVPAPMAVAVATQRDGTMRLLTTSAKPMLAEIDRSDAAEEGGQFREPSPARVPRRERLTVNWWPLAAFLSVIFGLPLCVWAWRTFA